MEGIGSSKSPATDSFLLLITAVLIIGVYAGLFFCWPVVAYDTDLWYHLSGGRYMAEEGKISTESFFSFISPPRPFINYYWLFQIIVYKVYSFAGYYGLVIVRAVLCAAAFLLMFAVLNRGRFTKRASVYAVILSSFFIVYFVPRFFQIRPHLFTYFFIVAFIYLFEFQRKYVFIIPILVALWSNIHGIQYPVILLIIFAYGIDFLWDVLRKKEKPFIGKENIVFMGSICLSVFSVLITPHNFLLLKVPFVSLKYVSDFIVELRDTNIFTLAYDNPLKTLVFQIILATVVFKCVALVFTKSLKVRHAALMIGGCILLAKGDRLTFEFILLSLPILSTETPGIIQITDRRVRYLLFLSFFIGLFVFHGWVMYDAVIHRPTYPFSTKNLPAGVAAFLKTINTNGTILNDPNHGGYFEWELYPKQKIFIDLQLPFMFNDEDAFVSNNVFFYSEVLKRTLVRYDPSFITVLPAFQRFREIIREHPHYVPVFYDDANILYINSRHYPEIAKTYQLRAADPYRMNIHQKIVLSIPAADEINSEIKRMRDIYPESASVNYVTALLISLKNNHKEAIPYAERIIHNFPDMSLGYKLMGNLLSDLSRFKDSISYYEKALRRADKNQAGRLYTSLSRSYEKIGEYEKAYACLYRVISPLSFNASAEDLYVLGYLAEKTGRYSEAAMTLRFAMSKARPHETELREKTGKILSTLGNKVDRVKWYNRLVLSLSSSIFGMFQK